MSYVFQVRRGVYLDWVLKNPVLRAGEPGYETDRKRLKIGDGVTHYNSLSYVNQDAESVPIDLDEHINSMTPHPVYDDGPSLVLLYENAKV